ncbi:MAG: UDP-N-acetylmuramate dehydrogenase [Candidatus Eremiobacteraeota bacterium]|nr:UDP-N-acetylmuramate dehydrogenase [Candidatus Eremiobacteraeota bacterium]MCW5868374.1 UDP-N-acetylmuramate dehydrogenase [Candidatus Eremiobacteraeota bacterium]
MTTTVSFRDLTTLEVGGEARRFMDVASCEQALAHYRQARLDGLPVLVLGGGSNMLVSDAGFDGLVLRWQDRSLEVLQESPEQVVVRVGGGRVWDEWVAETVSRQWSGLECLSGIPGLVGAAPIQNIGAYGQEVAGMIRAVRVLDWDTGEELRLTGAQCEFGYRDSRFKRDWKGRYLVTSVEFELRPKAVPQLRYKELQQRMEGLALTSAQVRQTVLEIRRSKSMVWDPADPNHRSAGSFFVNPIVSSEIAEKLAADFPGMPGWPAGPGRTKLSAAWLIERSGFPKGWGEGPAGLSSNHVLALINRGQARAVDLLRVAGAVRRGVFERFAVCLHPEPEFVGFERPWEELL